METRLARDDWMRAARLALLHGGPAAVRVEPLARKLGVTKGSFYWHFRDREDLLEALLREWEEEDSVITDALGGSDRGAALRALFEEVKRRTLASEKGEWPSDAALFSWAAVDPKVERRTRVAEERRMRLLRELMGDDDAADFFYYAYHGLLLRRRRVPEAVRDYDRIALMGLQLAGFGKAPGKRQRRGRRLASVAIGAALCLSVLQGCTTYRIARWQVPGPDIHEVLPQRAVRSAAQPIEFVAGPHRSDLDTVSVRNVDGRMIPFAEYLVQRRILAFVVVRNDSIIYEQYREDWRPDRPATVFSVSKAVFSALVGQALASGAVDLDRELSSYIPAVAGVPAYAGVTLRHAFEMTTGFEYTWPTGRLREDLRSDDARFFYSNDLRGLLLTRRRVHAPGSRWAYKDSDAELVGWALANAVGKSIAAQTEDQVWTRINTAHDASWTLDSRGGVEKIASGFVATPHDLARFARLYMNGGVWNGEQIVPASWVGSSTTLDTLRTEPEVVVWWRMQHNSYWWIPMHNWHAERDFFADGHAGQRLYVHPPTRTIIVQIADDSNQDFPFRKVAHYLAGQEYRYPQGMVGLIRRALEQHGADSAGTLFRTLQEQERTDPGSLFVNEATFIDVANSYLEDVGTHDAAVAMLQMAVERYPGSPVARQALASGLARVSAERRP